ncbi:MAG: thioredoxin family protein, partial [Candidatus Afipia apatlaquensis]|nr:thioredoxin family protein [Candidatus Afipia apatlaquensis]
PVRFTPTFIVVDNGREIGRITGYSNDNAFWGLLDALAAKLQTAARELNRI